MGHVVFALDALAHTNWKVQRSLVVEVFNS